MNMKKTELDIKPEQLARLKVSFALRRMAPEVQSDVLTGGLIAARSGIKLSHPIKLPEDITIDRATLFSAFQKTADGISVSEITDIGGVKRTVQVQIEGESAVLSYGSNSIRFPQAALLSSDVEKRRAAADIILKNNSLTLQAREEFNAIISNANFSHEDFFEATSILSSSPESFAAALRDIANKGTLSKADFLPSEGAYWENITAKRLHSETLQEFIGQELANERATRIALDLEAALNTISLTFGGPELVPSGTMRQIEPDRLLVSLRRLLEYADPFALSGVFDLCVDQSADGHFVELGDEVLDKLLGDLKRLQNELTIFAAAFVIASAHLSEHEILRKQPVFWRRLAAASHASLVVRILGTGTEDEPSLLDWATRLAGKTFYLAVLNDAYVEPRWRPDWISPNYLVADIYGRLLASLSRTGDVAKTSWRKKVDDAEAWVTANTPPIAYAFPAMLQGGMVTPIEKPPADTTAGKMYEKLAHEPTAENFLPFMPVVYAFGFHSDARESAVRVVQSLQMEIAYAQPEIAQAVLDLAAFIASRNRDTELADAVAALAIERLVATQNIDRLFPTFAVLVQCAAAMSDRKEAQATLARRLENLTFVASTELLPEALDTLRVLQSIDDDLGILLGRAIATARLGLPGQPDRSN
jgi:hypothetical protein